MFEAGDLFANQPCTMFTRPAPRFDLGAAEIRLGKPTQPQETLELVWLAEPQLGDRQRMKAKQVVSSLERISTEAVEIQPSAARDEDPTTRTAAVEQPLEIVAPTPVLVKLVEDPELRCRI